MSSLSSQEAVGAGYSLEAMQHAQELTWQVIDAIAERIKPGMCESEARHLGDALLQEMGMERTWHPLLVRFGSNTLKTFRDRSAEDRVLDERDIFFLDLGGVWNGHEGDAGATFVTPDADEEMRACAYAARLLYGEVEQYWRSERCEGVALYRYAKERAKLMGWRLNLDIKGHRVGDYPHAIHKAGDLGDFSQCPDVGLWILEIQIAHPHRAFGAFYEDLLI